MTTQMKHIEGSKLNTLIKASETADALAHYFALRQRTRPFTDIKRLNMDLTRGKFTMNEEESFDFFKALEKQGLGRFIHARKKDGHPVFAWDYDMKTVAQAAVEGTDTYAKMLSKDKARLQDGQRLKRKMNIGYPVKAAVVAHVQKQASNKVMEMEIKQVLTPPIEIQIGGQMLVAISQEEYNQLMKVKEFLTTIK